MIDKSMYDRAKKIIAAHVTWFREKRIKALHVVLAVSATFLAALLIGIHAGSPRHSRGARLEALPTCKDIRNPIFTERGLRYLPDCNSTFIRYRPSAWEVSWLRDIAALQSESPNWEEGCHRIASERSTVEMMFKEMGDNNHLYCINIELTKDIFSTLEAVERCAIPIGFVTMRHNHSIEPLVSFLRDPRAVCPLQGNSEFDRMAQEAVFSREFLILAQPPCDGVARAGRRILFAIGAKPAMGAVHTGDGTQWLVREYERRGIPFDAIYVWEGSGKVDVPLFWESIPEHLRPLTHFYNLPLETAPESALNPLRVILTVATPADFVVVKIDADDPEKEEQFVSLIEATKELVDIIDELFWEHVTTGSPMQWHGWGDAGRRSRMSLADTYRLLTLLRRKGIRAHSWA